MTTRARNFHNDEVRHGTKATQPEPPAPETGEGRYSHNDAARTDAKATHAIEEQQGAGTPTRKSTRAGSNRVKPDAPLTNTVKSKMNTPTTRNQRH